MEEAGISRKCGTSVLKDIAPRSMLKRNTMREGQVEEGEKRKRKRC
jgi:hypothetical protein